MTPDELIAFGKELKEEIKAQDTDGALFLPDQWLRFRRLGYLPEDIDYDMCHVWR